MPLPQTTSPAQSLWTLGCLFTLKSATPELEVIDCLVPPAYSPPLHRHDHVSESFYVLEGSIRFVVGDDETICGPGDFVRVPRSAPHSFESLGDEPSRVLDLIAPGGLWAFFVECGEPAGALTLPPAVTIPGDLPAIVARHNGAVLGPPINRA